MDWHMIQLILWLVAGIVSFYFSIGNARAWTSIAVGFGLILIGELIPAAVPYFSGLDSPQVKAMEYIIGTLSILIMSHGFLEYYVFSQTLEFEGKKLTVYLAALAVIGFSLAFVLLNPVPGEDALRTIQVVSLTNWVFLSLANMDLIRKIYLNVKDSPISKGFIAFLLVFFFMFLWKGSELYIRVYGLDILSGAYPFRYRFSVAVANLGNILASLTVGGTFIYLAKELR